MTSDKYLAVIGLSESDEAHLRLLMRRAAIDHLSFMWRWGNEDNADLIIIDPADFGGQMARNRAFSSGRRCAILGNEEELRDGELRLGRPLKLESVAEMLNEVAAAGLFDGLDAIVPNAQNFYQDDSLEAAPAPEPLPAPQEDEAEVELHLESGAQREATPAEGLDDLLKPDSAAKKPAFAVPFEITGDAVIESSRRVSARAERRVADSTDGLRRPERTSEINLSGSTPFEAPPAASLPSTLRDYLRGNLLGGPAMLSLRNAPSLTLDPKARVYHSSSNSLQGLVPYCRGVLPQKDWRVLTTTELARTREEQPARPYSRLLWLATVVNSGGRLAAHLDPGGRYRIKSGAAVDSDIPNHARISDAMRDLAKLNEIAAVSGASMAEVFDVVNGYEAIHAVETEKRQPRYSEPAAASGGLFSKLRKSLTGR